MFLQPIAHPLRPLANKIHSTHFHYVIHNKIDLVPSRLAWDKALFREVVAVAPVEDAPGQYSAAFASDLPFGSFYAQERTTNESFVLSDQQYPVVFAYAGQEAILVTIAVNDGEAISNEMIRGRTDRSVYARHGGIYQGKCPAW